jgi:hypothetical protein
MRKKAVGTHVTRIDRLTDAQKARFDEWADRWIEIGLRTGNADRPRFEAAVRECYRFAGLEPPKVIVWTTSPLVVSLAAPVAALLIEIHRRDAVGRAVGGAVRGAVGDAVSDAVGGAVRGAVDDAVGRAVSGAVRGAVRDAVGRAVSDAVSDAVGDAVGRAVGGAVRGAVGDAVGGAVRDAVGRAVSDAVSDAVGGAVGRAVDGAVGGAVGDAVDGAVGGAVGGAVRDAVRGAVGRAVDGAVGRAVGGAVGGAVDGAVGRAVGRAVGGAVGGAVRDAVRGAVGDAVGGAVRGAVRGAVSDAVGDAVRGAVGDAVSDAVSGAVGGAVDGAVGGVIRRAWGASIGGQFWVGGWWWGGAWTSFFREVCGLQLNGDLWMRSLAYEATLESTCWWWPHRDFVIVSERPVTIHRELVNPDRPRGWDSHRLHCEDGPAVAFKDGWGIWAWHGNRVTRQIVEQPETLTVDQVRFESNAEVRRVMVERMGWDAFCASAKMKLLHVDELHSNFPDIPVSEVVDASSRMVTSYRAGVERAELLESAELRDFEDRPLRFVRLSDPSTGGQYTLRVLHDHTRCYEAIGWTFGVDETTYKRGRFLRQGDVFLQPLAGGPLQQAHS